MRIWSRFKFVSRLTNQFYLWLRRYSLNTRFFIACISLCVVPLVLAAGIVFFTSYSREMDNYISFTQQNMVQTSNNLFGRLMNVRTDAIDFAYNSYIQDYTKAYGSAKSSVGRVPVTEELVHSVVGRFNSTSDSSGVIILSTDGRPCYVYNNQNRFYMYFYEKSKANIMKNVDDSRNGYWHYATPEDYYLKSVDRYAQQPDEPVIYYALKMKRLIGDESVGYLIMTLRAGVLAELFSNLDRDGASTVYLLDRDGNVIIHTGEEDTADRADWMEYLSSVNSSKIEVFHPEGMLDNTLIAMKMEETGWYVVNVIDGGVLSQIALNSSAGVITLLLIMMVLVPCVFFLLNRTMKPPLWRIVNSLNRVQQGDFSSRIQDQGCDEFAIIAQSIDVMAGRLETMIEQIKSSEKQRQELQIELLQMQINPHFITNTLNMTAWMADLQQQTKLAHILQSLSSLLNRTLRSGRDFIPLSEELDYIRWYLNIQQYRGIASYRLNVSLDDSLFDCLLPPFTLEPLVENSVIHGTVAGRSSLNITIKGFRTKDIVEISVIDDGCGMDAGILERLNHTAEMRTSREHSIHGIGIANVQKRLQIYFGEEYGVSYDSMQGCFTIATVRIPVRIDGTDKTEEQKERWENVPCDDCR